MPLRASEKKARLIKKIATAFRRMAGRAKRKEAERFLSRFYENVAFDDIDGAAPKDLAGAALSIWGFAQSRKPGAIKLRIFNPESGKDNWSSQSTIVEIVNDDMPFLVDSVTAELARLECEVRLVIHPIVPLSRTPKGRFQRIHDPKLAKGGARRESWMHVAIGQQPHARFEEIRKALHNVLGDVRVAVEDWRTMRQRCRELITELEHTPPGLPENEIDEGLDFLKWIDEDHFTYLGYREYSFRGRGAKAVARIDKKTGLGLLRDPDYSVFDGLRSLGTLPPEVQDFVKRPQLLRITKANRRATVHRPVHLDTIAVKKLDKTGKVIGERLFIGLFTSTAYSRSPRDIPLLRQKVDNVVDRTGFSPSSHDGKALAHILETYPRDELFQIAEDDLLDIALGVLHLQERQRVALFVRRDPFERFVSCMVYVPRDRYDTKLRMKLQEIIAAAYGGTVSNFATYLGNETLARLHLIIRTKQGKVPAVDAAKLEAELAEAARSWSDGLRYRLTEMQGEAEGLRLHKRYSNAFPMGYQDRFDAARARLDILHLEQALASGGLSLNLMREEGEAEDRLHFLVYSPAQPLSLSDVLPVLENMGLKAISEVPFEIKPDESSTTIWLHDFGCRLEGELHGPLEELREHFHTVFAAVWHGQMENDGFNRLVLRGGIAPREIVVLRSYCKYLRQAQIPFSQTYMEETLAGNAAIAAKLVELFMLRFDSKASGRAKSGEAALTSKIEASLEAVANLDEDRILRRYLNAIQATLRTNFFQDSDSGGAKDYLSFKLDSRRIDELPRPRPFREIFVYSPRVEGVHLRFGKVARGGLRWSDRREDFRTEILGLVKAQQVKNAVIVPVGSKGGFVVKNPPPAGAGREAVMEEGIACYKIFIRGLLDLTDNLKGGKVVPPKAVVRHDEDDPYLVVAADKGTATFSDIANGVSKDYGFWLDDAFASGGSAGYDHKKMGITARGAWESVKRHFREIGKNIQEEPFTVIGVGDMSGDVFGNGMLLSEQIKLKAAFNHLHVFVDPEPDPKRSFAERARLFELPRSAWSDYDAKLISKGGGVFDRKAKSIKISAEMKQAFGIEADSMTPNDLIKGILKSNAELLWFGGIGTYVKSSDESNADVGDRTNDALRIDADELKAQVVGEGANLGMTQQARIEYGLAGGRCNTDSIDNSAGVDCSDHEVNIKILLGEAEAKGKLTRKQRDRLLARMTDEVAELVLRDNYLQTQAITVTHRLGAHLIDRIARYMRSLEKSGHLDRQLEFLPDDEVVSERMAKQLGMARAELAVLLSYSKIVLYDELLACELPDDPYLADDLARYFPTPLRKTYAKEIASHRLRREIIATVVTNNMINRQGITFVHEAREKTGMPTAAIARAYLIAREIFRVRKLTHAVESLDNKVPAHLQARMLVEVGRAVERATVWFLRAIPESLEIGKQVEVYGKGMMDLADQLPRLMSDADCRLLAEQQANFESEGAPADLARRIATLHFLPPTLDVVRIGGETGRALSEVGEVYYTVGARFGFDQLRRAAALLGTDTAWEKLAVSAVVDDLFGNQSEIARRIASGLKNGAEIEERLGAFSRARAPLVARSEQLISEISAASSPDLAMITVANRQLKSLTGG